MSKRHIRTAAVALLLSFPTAVMFAPPAGSAPGGQPGPPLAPRTHFVMEPDGSSGLTAGGEFVPNMDSVKATIRAYYNASS